MSQLSVFWPEECDVSSDDMVDERMILPFPRSRYEAAYPRMDVITRARTLFENRSCRHCGYPVVELIELDDGLVNSSGREIPGTATLIGFECKSCEATWSI